MLTVKKTRRDYSCRWSHMESGGSSGAHGVSQVQCTWRFDARTNSRWWRIFAKVEFVRVVSNIVYKVGYSWTMSCIVFTGYGVVFK